MANPTNPNRVVRVKDLNRFKGKCDERFVAQSAQINAVFQEDTLVFFTGTTPPSND